MLREEVRAGKWLHCEQCRVELLCAHLRLLQDIQGTVQTILVDDLSCEDVGSDEIALGWIAQELRSVVPSGECFCVGKQPATEGNECVICQGGLDYDTIGEVIISAEKFIKKLLAIGYADVPTKVMEGMLTKIIRSPHPVRRKPGDALNSTKGLHLAYDMEQELLDLIDLLYASLGLPEHDLMTLIEQDEEQPDINDQKQRGVHVRDFSRDTTDEVRQRAREEWSKGEWNEEIKQTAMADECKDVVRAKQEAQWLEDAKRASQYLAMTPVED